MAQSKEGDKERLQLAREDFYSFALKLCRFKLTDRELKVLLFRYYCKLTLKKTGEVLNGRISKQRVSQIEQKALKKIKKSFTFRNS